MVHASIVLNAVEGASLSCWTSAGHGTAVLSCWWRATAARADSITLIKVCECDLTVPQNRLTISP